MTKLYLQCICLLSLHRTPISTLTQPYCHTNGHPKSQLHLFSECKRAGRTAHQLRKRNSASTAPRPVGSLLSTGVQPPLHRWAASYGTRARAALQQVQSNPRLLPRALSGRAWRWYCVRAPAAPPAAAPASLNRVTGRREWRPSETRPVLWRASIRPAGACAGGSSGPRYSSSPDRGQVSAQAPPLVGCLLSTGGQPPLHPGAGASGGQPPLHRWAASSPPVHSLLSTSVQPPLHRCRRSLRRARQKPNTVQTVIFFNFNSLTPLF